MFDVDCVFATHVWGASMAHAIEAGQCFFALEFSDRRYLLRSAEERTESCPEIWVAPAGPPTEAVWREAAAHAATPDTLSIVLLPDDSIEESRRAASAALAGQPVDADSICLAQTHPAVLDPGGCAVADRPRRFQYNR